MALLVFLGLKASRVIDSPFDWYWVCLLLALEGPGYLNTLRLWMLRR